MGLLKKLENAQAFLKLGGYGFEGSGKTTSLSLIAIGLHRFIKSKKPIGFYDTETGSSYVKALFDHAKIDVLAVRSRSLKDLGDTIKEAEKECDILIADSLTHPYKELCSTFVRNKKDGTKFIRMQDWQIIKDAWNNKFAEPYVNSKLHFLWGARAKNLFEDVLDEQATAQAGKDIYRSQQIGTGARAETESSFEPGILVEFTREYKDQDGKASKKSGIFHRRLTITKDRFMTLDGMSFIVETPQNGKGVDLAKMVDENPTFKFFLPHIEKLNISGSHEGFNQSDSSELFDDNGNTEAIKKRQEVTIMLEEIENTLIQYWPSSQSPTDRKAKLSVLKWAFQSNSWTAIKSMAHEMIKAGHEKIVKSDKSKLFEVADNVEQTLADTL